MKKLFIVMAALGLFVAAAAQQMPPIPVDGNVRIGHLDNGLTYYIRHNEEPKGQANFYIAQKVGSILEDENQRGLAHFLEHMCFNGTEHFPGNGVVKYCEKIGVQFGGDLNAYTSIDETVYNIDNVPVATVPEAVDSCLWILHDWADGLLLNGEDIDKERGVIHEEWRSRQNAQMRMYDQILPKIYPDGNVYGLRMPIGLMEVVDNFPYQAIRDYYEKWYRPDQQGIVVVGDIDVDAVEAKIQSIFGTIVAPVNPAERFYVQVPDNKEPIIAIAKDKEQPYAVTFIFKKHEDYPDEMKGDLNYLIVGYADQMIASMFAQRIEEISMQANPPFMQASIDNEDFFISKTKQALTGLAITSEDGVLKGATAVYREMLRAVRGGFTASEYDRARANFLTHLESQYNEREKTRSINYCKEYVRHFIDNEPIPGIENEYALANQLAPNIPVEVINQVLASYFEEGNLVVVSMLPDKEGVACPTEAEVADAFAAVEAEDIKPYEDKVSDEPLLSQLPAAGKIVKKAPAQFGYTLYTLSNGAKVYVKSTDFKADEIRMDAFSWGGQSLYPVSDVKTLDMINELMSIGGLGSFNATELTKALSGKKVNLNRTVSMYSEALNGSTTPKDFETLLQLTYLSFTAQRSDDEAYASFVNRMAPQLKNAELNPMTALSDAIYETVYDNHPRAVRFKYEDLEKIDYARAMQIAKERFGGAADFSFIFTGNFDEATMMPLVEQYIGGLPAGVKKEKYKDVKMNIAKGARQNIFDKEMETPAATVVFANSGKAKYNLFNSLAFSLATDCLDIIFTEEIREKEGGTYGVQVSSSFATEPKPQQLIQVVYQTDPEKYEHLNSRIDEIVADFIANGPKESDLAKVKDLRQKRYTENLRKNNYFASQLKEYIQTGVDFVSDYEAVLKSITPKDCAEAIGKLYKQGNDIDIVMVGKAAE